MGAQLARVARQLSFTDVFFPVTSVNPVPAAALRALGRRECSDVASMRIVPRHRAGFTGPPQRRPTLVVPERAITTRCAIASRPTAGNGIGVTGGGLTGAWSDGDWPLPVGVWPLPVCVCARFRSASRPRPSR